jgi:hypothetical protein
MDGYFVNMGQISGKWIFVNMDRISGEIDGYFVNMDRISGKMGAYFVNIDQVFGKEQTVTGDQIRDDKISPACGAYGRKEGSMQGFCGET